MSAYDILKNNKKGSLRDLCIELSSHMVSLGLDINYDEAKNMVIENLSYSYDGVNKVFEKTNCFHLATFFG